jgi:hypothetical protein
MKAKTILSLLVVVGGLLASALTPRTARAQQRGLGVDGTAASTGDLYYALVVGNSDYDSLPKLGNAATDARAVERVLRESYGFQTRLLVNATRSEIVAALSDYKRSLSVDASLLVYYAGHGHRDAEARKTFWLPVDATLEDVSGWIVADEMTNGVRVIPAHHVLVVSDSCYSGTLPYRNSGHQSGDFVFTRIKPPAALGSCDDLEAKATLYETFLDNFKGNPEQQKVAYEAGKNYVSKYESCPKESDKTVVAYLQKWLEKYEAAVRDWQRWHSRQP